MLVKETISFERYRDPKTALGLNPIEYYFDIERPSAEIYRFVEKRRTEWSTKLKYTYSIDKGNIYIKKPQSYATQELRSRSFAFNKGNPKKMAMSNDLKGAEEFILNHYLKLLKKEGVKESVSFERYRDPKEALGLKLHFLYNIEYDPETEGFSYEQNNEAIGKYIKTLIPEISDNEIDRFISFTIEGYINDVIPISLFENKDEQLIEEYLMALIKRESSHWMKIHSDKAMRGIAKNSGMNI